MTLRRAAVEVRLLRLEEELRHLAGKCPERAVDLAASWEVRRLVESTLRLCLEIVLDVANIIAAGELDVVAETSREAVSALVASSVIRPELGEKLGGAAGLRNILTHRYLRIDLALLHDHARAAVEDLPDLVADVRAWLDQRDSGEE